jgi:THO complex subunit 4
VQAAQRGFVSKGLAQGGAKVSIKNLHYEVTDDKLREIFKVYGTIHSATIVWDKHDRSTGEALVVFERPSEANEAIARVNGTAIEGQ